LAGRQAGVIPPLGPGIARLLAPLPLGAPGVITGIVQVIRTILRWRGLAAPTEEFGLELPLLTAEFFDLLFQLANTGQGITMATLPIAGLLAQLEILALQVSDSGAQYGHVPAQIVQRGHPIGGGVIGATDSSQLAVHSQLPLPEMSRSEKRWHSDHHEEWLTGHSEQPGEVTTEQTGWTVDYGRIAPSPSIPSSKEFQNF